MPRTLSHLPTLLAACIVVATTTTPARTDPIRLAEPDRVPLNATSMVVADLDGTKGPDLIGASGGSMLVALNDGTGHFGSPLAFPMGLPSLTRIAVRDLDGNGLPDLLAVSGTTVTVRLQDAPLVFEPVETYTLPAPLGWGFVLADFDHDGRPELAATGTDFVAVLRNDGNGHFTSARVLPVPGALSQPVAGDFNGDGEVDLLIGVSGSSPPLEFLAGHGDGTFAPATSASPPCPIRVHLVAADLDADGDLDLLGTDEASVYVFAGHGDGTFDCAVKIGGGQQAYADPVIGDIDGDGRSDIALSQRTDWFGPLGNVITFRNLGGLAFERGVRNKVGPNPGDTWVGDLDGDGKVDLAALCGPGGGPCFNTDVPGVAIAHNSGAGTLNTMLEVAEPVWLPVHVAGRLVPDLVGANSAGELMLARNRGNGAFDPAIPAGRGTPLAARDLDGDGNEELIVSSGDSLSVLLGLGAGAFGPPHFVASGLTFCDFGDFDHDHRLDLLARSASTDLVVARGDGTGGFEIPAPLGLHPAAAPDDIRAADLDRDGWTDVLALESSATAVHLISWRSDRAGGFLPPDSTSVDNSPEGAGCLRLGDWNGDGHLDALHLHLGCTDGTWEGAENFLGHGDGTFEPDSVYRGNSWCDAQIADLDGDHLDDVVTVISTAGCWFHVFTQRSEAGGGFTTATYSMGVEPHTVFLADLDGDGRLDVVTHNERYGVSYSIRRNLSPLPLATPTLMSLVSARVEDGVVHLTWYSTGAAVQSVSVERRDAGGAWITLGTVVSDGSGYFRFDDRSAIGGTRYAYRARVAGRSETSSEAWVEIPSPDFRIVGVRPNPASSHPLMSFALPFAGDAEVRVYDVAGRLVLQKPLAGLSAGTHRVDLGETALRPGLYAATLRFAGRTRHARFLVIP